MLADLLFGSYRKKVLGVLLLQPDASFHVRELARLTGTAAGTLHKELSRLAAAGLLTRQQLGNQVRYQANRQCPIYAELAAVLRKTAGCTYLLAQALRPLQPELALVFGSVARGSETSASDVDVLVVSACSFGDVVRALHPAQIELGREINPVLYSPAELRQKAHEREPFVLNLLAGPHLYLIGGSDELEQLVGHPAPAAL